MEEKKANTTSMGTGTSKKNTGVIILLSVLLAIVIAVSAYLIFTTKGEVEERTTELKVAYDRLDSIGKQLDEKIIQIEELGGDITELQEAKAQVEAEKEDIWKSKKYTESQLNKYKTKVEGFKELLLTKDNEIAKLKEVNEVLQTENLELKNEKVSLEKNLAEAQKTQTELSKKVEVASRLKAENIVISAMSSKGRERIGEFKSRNVDKIKVEFNIAKNDVAPVEGKELLMRISDINGEVLFDVAKGSGTFMLDGKESFYTLKQEILFDNSNQKVSFLYDKGSEYMPGIYKMEVFTDGYLLGTSKFTVK